MKDRIKTYYSDAPKEKSKFATKLSNAFKYNTGTKKRIWELDIMRGILMIFVTLDHACNFGLKLGIFDFNTFIGMQIHDFAAMYCSSAFRNGIQPFGLFLFCYLSGINCSFSRSKFKRVLKMWIICAIFMGTVAILHLIVPDFVTGPLMFNIIAVITICVTVWWFFDLIKCPTWIRFALGVAIIAIGLTHYYMYYIRDFSYINNDLLALLVYNSHARDLCPDNFEPLFPHLGWFILGAVMGRYIYRQRKTLTEHEEPYKPFIPLAYIGKHSLVVYVIGTFVVLLSALGIRELVALFL